MNYDSSRNKSTLITAAGILIFLAAGIFTMLFFPEREQTLDNRITMQPKKISLDIAASIDEPQENSSAKVEEAKTPKSDWYVYVTGEVKNPGYYKISPDSRIFQAVEAAGGFTKKADIASVNMAASLIDGFQVDVKAKGKNKITNNSTNVNVRIPGVQVRPANPIVLTPTRTFSNVDNDGQIDINNATAKEIEQLKGVGPAIAKRIVEYRNSHGKFSTAEDLLNVKGIGKAKFEKMRPQILIR